MRQKQTGAAVRNELGFEVVRAFQTVLKTTQFVHATEAAVTAFEGNQAAAKKRLAGGTLLKSDELDIEVRLTQAREDLVRARNANTLAVLTLRNLLGIESEDFAVAEIAPVAIAPIGGDFSHRPELAAANEHERAAQAEIKGAKSGYQPRVSAFGSLDHDYGWVTGGDGNSYSAGVMLQWDLWDGFSNRAKTREAKANLESASEEKRKLRLALDLEVEQARLNLQATDERLAVTAKSEEQAEESAKLTRDRFAQGMAISTQLIDAEPRWSPPACVAPNPSPTSALPWPHCEKLLLCPNLTPNRPLNDMKRLMPIPRLSFVTAVACLASAMCFTGCGAKPENSGANSTSLPTAQVRAQTVERKARAATEEVVGTVRPKLSATIEAKVSGRIDKMRGVPGQAVKSGESLAHLDAAEISSRMDQADAALAQAEQDWKRISTLFGQQASTKSEYDAADARYHMAKAAAAEAKTMMSYCEVLAPFDGVITRKLADVGDLAVPGKPLLQMENPDTLRLEADVPEALVGNVRLGDKLAVRIAAVTSEMEGTVAELSPTADPNSRTYLVKLDLPGATGLRSGQFGRVSVPVGEATAIRVPASAVILRGQMELVFVVVGNHAQMRLVKTGSRVSDEIELVSGLNSGEQVVTENVSDLIDGQPVTIKP